MQFDIPLLAVGFVVSAVVGILAINLVKLITKKNKFKIFGIYLLIIGILCVFGGVYENVTGKMIEFNFNF